MFIKIYNKPTNTGIANELENERNVKIYAIGFKVNTYIMSLNYIVQCKYMLKSRKMTAFNENITFLGLTSPGTLKL